MTMWMRVLIWIGVLAAAALLVGGVVKGYEHWRDSVRAEGKADGLREKQAEWDEADRKRDLEALAKVAEDNIESKRRMALQERNRAEIDRERRAAVADARAARAESLRMSEWADAQVRIAAANRGAADPAAGQQCEAAGGAAGVLAHVLKQLDERAGILAEYADRARLAGQQCERDYQALTLKATTPP